MLTHYFLYQKVLFVFLEQQGDRFPILVGHPVLGSEHADASSFRLAGRFDDHLLQVPAKRNGFFFGHRPPFEIVIPVHVLENGMGDILSREKEVTHILVPVGALEPMEIRPGNEFAHVEILGNIFLGKNSVPRIEILVAIEGNLPAGHAYIEILYLLLLRTGKLPAMLQVLEILGDPHLPPLHLLPLLVAVPDPIEKFIHDFENV